MKNSIKKNIKGIIIIATAFAVLIASISLMGCDDSIRVLTDEEALAYQYSKEANATSSEEGKTFEFSDEEMQQMLEDGEFVGTDGNTYYVETEIDNTGNKNVIIKDSNGGVKAYSHEKSNETATETSVTEATMSEFESLVAEAKKRDEIYKSMNIYGDKPGDKNYCDAWEGHYHYAEDMGNEQYHEGDLRFGHWVEAHDYQQPIYSPDDFFLVIGYRTEHVERHWIQDKYECIYCGQILELDDFSCVGYLGSW